VCEARFSHWEKKLSCAGRVAPVQAARRAKVANVFDKNLLQQKNGESQPTLSEANGDGIHRMVDMELNQNDESSAILRVLELIRIDSFEVFWAARSWRSQAPRRCSWMNPSHEPGQVVIAGSALHPSE
jgi:UDP-N-acetyl-D-mannosaminuronic acid transferase (WecB/TagA/CpsF family)